MGYFLCVRFVYKLFLVKEIMDWICPPTIDPGADQELRYGLLTNHTGTWIFQNQKYDEWYNGSGAFLWLYGPSIPYDIFCLLSSGLRKAHFKV